MAFITGDSQCSVQRIKALLLQEGFVDEDGNRLRKDETLIHIGDVGDYYSNTKIQDLENWMYVKDIYDLFLYGNHDYGIFDSSIRFDGYTKPLEETLNIINDVQDDGRMVFAAAEDGFLITHAGVHPEYEEFLSSNPKECANLLNSISNDGGIFTSIGPVRGGWSFSHPGGIIWRDISEDISDKWPQIHGHSRVLKAGAYCKPDRSVKHYAIDIGFPNNGKLAGIFTDTQKIAEVNVNKK